MYMQLIMDCRSAGRFAPAIAKSYSHSVSPRAVAGDQDGAFSKT